MFNSKNLTIISDFTILKTLNNSENETDELFLHVCSVINYVFTL